ncbi:GvpL/GvpF family gas vesicle protein [Actinacidiphila rubida]|uniref:Gas vesicle synthesis protein GvpL/GvpF n=1 Tax=Actinacidiphila rubida TaxID=310780 RepID=A0A1H8TJ96_9ACTN|nr:GvpL/GvpF family gas vesicle protein [Actinacidiphila rubida]SEO90947.1 Gas vesicle synthesis protein GvpL/GvpF [Actinacidiphila rubida]
MGVYIYGVAGASPRIPAGLRGVGKPPAALRRVVANRVTAVVSAAPDHLRAYRRDLQAHQNVLMAFADQGPVLPMRFGVVVADEDAVRARLEEGGKEYEAALDRVADRVEMNVKVSAAEGDLAEIVQQDPRVQQLRHQARRRPGYEINLRLGEAIATAIGRRAAQAAAQVSAVLTPLADDVRKGPEVTGCVLNMSFLIRADAVEQFRAETGRLANRHMAHAVLQLTGPLPCYSFAVAVVPEPV